VENRFQYRGTGGGMFCQMFVGILLCIVTLGIYTPWFIARLYRYLLENTTMTTPAGDVKFQFRGKGGEMFGIMFVGGLLTLVTLGIYYSWFVARMSSYLAGNIAGTDASGREYTGAFNGRGGSLFCVIFVGVLLSIITFGIYSPWFMCKFVKFMTENMVIMSGGQPVGKFTFNGSGGSLFGTLLVGGILCGLTLCIYYPWFMVNLMKFYANATTVEVEGSTGRFLFNGTGGKLFGIMLLGAILSLLTLGIYSFWFMTNMIRFKAENTTVAVSAPASATFQPATGTSPL